MRINGIDIIEDTDGITENMNEIVRRAASTALSYEKKSGDISVMITDQDQIQILNREYRKIDRVTDVLTFPAWEGEELPAVPDGYLGDIAICLQRAQSQAEEYGHSLERELAFLTIHGCLHLCGYDHMTENEEYEMREHQRKILEILGLRV